MEKRSRGIDTIRARKHCHFCGKGHNGKKSERKKDTSTTKSKMGLTK